MTTCRKNLPHGLSKSLSAGSLGLRARIWLSQFLVTGLIVPLIQPIEGMANLSPPDLVRF